MNEVIERLFKLANKVCDDDLYDEVIEIANEISDIKENLIQSLESIDEIRGLEDVMEDIQIIKEKLERE
ncbi:MAG: hypothetical protein SOY42_12855 [Clostridium sp.]|nr:hypothetical protein [Clostridium sp.]